MDQLIIEILSKVQPEIVIATIIILFMTWQLPKTMRIILSYRRIRVVDRRTREKIELLQQELEEAKNDGTFALPENRKDWLNIVTENVSKDINYQVLHTLEERYSKSAKASLMQQAFEDSLARLYENLTVEKDTVSNRSGTNLAIGVVAGVLAVLFLFISIPSAAELKEWHAGHTVQVVTRVVLAFFIQFLCFFFLALYRNGLQEVKFYQNELSNLDYIRAGMFLAKETGDSDTLHQIAITLSKMERNFILKKGEATAGMLQHSYETERATPTETAAILAELRKMNGSAQPSGKGAQ